MIHINGKPRVFEKNLNSFYLKQKKILLRLKVHNLKKNKNVNRLPLVSPFHTVENIQKNRYECTKKKTAKREL